MAYADGAINVNTPDDSALLGQGDDRIRELKRQLRDRLLTLTTDPDADPLILAAGTVPTAAIQDNAVTTAKLGNKAVTATQIADETITANQIAPNAIGASELADAAVDTAAIADAAVTDAKIAGVSGSKLSDGSVGTAKLADNAVNSAKLADGSVTTSKIADNAVGTAEIANNAVTAAKIPDGSITSAKLDAATAASLLEHRYVDITLPAVNLGARTSATQAMTAFPGIVALDPVFVSLPTQYGDLTDASQVKLCSADVVAYTDQVKLILRNPNDGPLILPAGTYRIHCTKPSSEW